MVEGITNSGAIAAEPRAVLPPLQLPAQVAGRLPVEADINLTSIETFRAVDDLFDLSAESRNLNLRISNLNEPEIAEYLSLTASLLQAGVVGYEDLDVDGRPTRSFVPFEIADGYTRGARPYRGPDPTGGQINLAG